MLSLIKDKRAKAAVEGAVGDCTVAIVGKLRNRKFFSFEDLNKAIIKELDNFNNRPFQKKDGSRKSVYLDEELPFMKALPEQPFELSVWKRAKVQLNYHISIEKMNYSVPYEYVGNYVDVKVTKRTVTVYYKMNQICTHNRLYGRINQYSTNESHMPENHQKFQWNKDRFMKWAASIGDNTSILVSKLFDRYKVEEQAYKGCMSLLKLSDKYGKTRLEKCSAETVYKLAKVLGVSMEMLTVAAIQNAERERAYEYGLPEYLQHDLDAYKEGLKTKSDLLDCLWGELYGSINIAEINDGAITREHAGFLRNKYLFGGKHDRND